MKIKIERSIVSEFNKTTGYCEHKDLYYIYHGFTGLPHTFPFCTKWILDKGGISYEEMKIYVMNYVCLGGKTIIIKI